MENGLEIRRLKRRIEAFERGSLYESGLKVRRELLLGEHGGARRRVRTSSEEGLDVVAMASSEGAVALHEFELGSRWGIEAGLFEELTYRGASSVLAGLDASPWGSQRTRRSIGSLHFNNRTAPPASRQMLRTRCGPGPWPPVLDTSDSGLWRWSTR